MTESTNKSRVYFLAAALLAAAGQSLLAQPEKAWTLAPALVFYGVSIYFFLGQTDRFPEQRKAGLVSGEWGWFSLILLLAAFFRIYKLDSIPSGLFLDVSGPGELALRMVYENWKPPLMLPHYLQNTSFLLYPLSFWFKWFAPTRENLLLFFAVYSLAAFPFIYWFFRQLTGPRGALLSLYFIAVMRWHWVFSRNGYRNIQVVFYVFGALSFLLYGLRRGKKWSFFAAALLGTAGLYTYQSFKVFPLLVLVFLAYEFKKDRRILQANALPLLLSAFMAAAGAWPLLSRWVQEGSLGQREGSVFIGHSIAQAHSLRPLWDRVVQTLLEFNRRGEVWPRHNFKDHRLLDDVTGVFFVLGFFYAWKRLGERPFFYALAGFFILCLPGFLSGDPVECHRLLAAAPFVAFFSASAFWAFWDRGKEIFPRKRFWLSVLMAGLLLLAALQNFQVYFADQADDPDCWKSYSPEAAEVGETIAASPDTLFYLAPAFDYHFTVQYLAYFDSSRVREFRWDSLGKDPAFTGKKVCFVLDGGKGPTEAFLKKVYPGGKEETFRDPRGPVLAYFYTLPFPLPPVRFSGGLEEQTYPGPLPEGKPLEQRRDLLVNFTTIGDLGALQAPFCAQWTGTLRVPVGGDYEFQLLTADEGELFLDGREVDRAPGTGVCHLQAGNHRLKIFARRLSETEVGMDFHLLWKKPGDKGLGPITPEAFGVGLAP